MIIKKILVAVDGSTPSVNASNYAIDLANIHGAELIAIYVVSPNIPYSPLEDAQVGRFREIVDMETKDGEQKIESVRKKAFEMKVRFESDVITSTKLVAETIVEYSNEKKADLVVVGSRGMTGIKKLFLGSVATSVVSHSRCPVLVVK